MAASVQSLRAELQDQQRSRSYQHWSEMYQEMVRDFDQYIDSNGVMQWIASDGGWWYPHAGSGFLIVQHGDFDSEATEQEYANYYGGAQDQAEQMMAMYLALVGLQHISEWRLWTPVGGVNRSGFDFNGGFGHGYYVPYGLTYEQALQSYYYNARTGQKILAYGQDPNGPIVGELMRIEAQDTATVFYLSFDGAGLPIYRAFIMSKGDGLMEFLLIASFVFTPFIGGAVAGMVGEAIVGPATAAAYPALTKAIGAVVVNTVMSGGDVAGAVKGVALGYVGGQAGSVVSDSVTQGLSDYSWASKLGETAGSLTRIAVNTAGGGNPTTGLVNLAIKSGATMFDWLTDDSSGDEYIPGYFDTPQTPLGWDDLGNGNYYDPANDTIHYADGSYSTWDESDRETVHYADYDYIENADGTFTEAWRDGSFTTVDAAGNVLETMDANGNVYTGDGPADPANSSGPPRQNIPSGPGVVQASNGINWPQAAAAIIGGILAWQKAGGLNPQLGSSTRVGNSVVTPNKNGTITTRYANGQTVVSKMPVGQPYQFPDGSTVMNNGDGSITTVLANGTTSRSAIPNVGTGNASGGLFGGMSTQTMLLLGGGAVALMLMSKGSGGKRAAHH